MQRQNSPVSHLLDLAGGHFSGLSLRRGREYAEQGQVSLRTVRREPAQISVEAVVDEAANRQSVALWLGLERGEVINVDAVCSCPVEEDCKHIVAALLAFEKVDQRLDDSPATEESVMEGYPVPGEAAVEWLDALATIGPRAAKAYSEGGDRTGIIYRLHLGETPGISLALRMPARRGSRGKLISFRPQPYDLANGREGRSPVEASDLAPLRLFLALQAGGGYFYNDAVALSGETGGLLLRLALATGRLELDVDGGLPLHQGPPMPCRWQWSVDAAGLHLLRPDLPDALRVIGTYPAWYLDLAKACIGELTTELAAAEFELLLSAPPLNEAEADLARLRLEEIAGRGGPQLPLPMLAPPETAGTPALRLRLATGRFRHPGAARLEERMAVAWPWFDYADDLRVPAVEGATPFLRVSVGAGWRTLLRNLDAEARWHRLLREAGLRSWQSGSTARLIAVDGAAGMVPDRNDAVGWLDFLNQGLPWLQEQGVEVEFAADFPYTIAQAEDWFVAVEESVGSDWFDLDLGVRIGDERISLVAPLMRLLRDQPDLSATVRSLDDADVFPVAIDERRILPVPAGRLKAWLLPLLEFLDDDRPRLSRHHAAALSGLEAMPAQWLGGEELRALGRRLRDFSGIERRPPAPGFNAVLRPYQQEGLDWLQFLREYGLSGILADDMGLGKTVQSLAHLHLEKHAGRADRPSLVVATTSLMANWRNEAAQFAPDLKVVTLHGKDRSRYFGEIAGADLVLTTYPLLVRDREALLAQEWHLLIMDEAQFIKNPKAQSHQVARLMKARHRLSLTGTPLENHLGELWAQFDYLMPGFLGSSKRFTQVYRTPIEKLGEDELRDRLRDRVRPFLLRRTKEQVLDDLPPRTEMVRWVDVEGGQRDLYESLRVAFDRKLRHALVEQGVARSQIMIFDALLKLRQICCDPRLVRLPAAEALVSKGHAHSAKLDTLMEMLPELLDEGRRVLLFSQFTSMLALIEPELDRHGIRYVKLTGQTRDRETPIRDFQEGRAPLFLISLKAGGTGLNLTAADTVIHYDPWWNPAVEEQATARAHRIGQDKPVFVYKLMTQGTVEERILALQDRKRGLADQLMRQGSGPAPGGNLLTASDLDILFQAMD